MQVQMFETVINLSPEQRTLFSDKKTTISHLKKLGFTVVKENGYGAWFDLQDITIELKILKKRGDGFKTTTL